MSEDFIILRLSRPEAEGLLAIAREGRMVLDLPGSRLIHGLETAPNRRGARAATKRLRLALASLPIDTATEPCA